MESERKYMRAKELAIYLGVGITTIWLWSREKKLTAKKISAKVTVFEIAEAEKLVNGA